MTPTQRLIISLYETYPKTRQSLNALVFAYWVKVNGYGVSEKDFAKTTPLETITREAREVWRRRPEFSPTAYHADSTSASGDLFALVNEVFPGTRHEMLVS